MSYLPFRPRGRFYLVDTREGGDGWTLADDLDGSCVSFANRAQAEAAAGFARAYVRRHGDIDLQAFPYRLTSPLSYAHADPFSNGRSSRPWGLRDGQVIHPPAPRAVLCERTCPMTPLPPLLAAQLTASRPEPCDCGAHDEEPPRGLSPNSPPPAPTWETLEALRRCAGSWDADARPLGNVRAADIVAAMDACLALLKPAPPELRPAVTTIQPRKG